MAARFDLLKRFGGVDGLRAALVSRPDLRAEIEAELHEIREHGDKPGEGISRGRCVITAEYRDALRKALL